MQRAFSITRDEGGPGYWNITNYLIGFSTIAQCGWAAVFAHNDANPMNAILYHHAQQIHMAVLMFKEIPIPQQHITSTNQLWRAAES